MSRRPWRSRCASLLTGLALIAGASVTSGHIPTARADERNLVAFGDSVLADPDVGTYLAHRFDPNGSVGVNCPTSNNYAKRAGAKLGLVVRDFSCAGMATMSPGPQLSQQIDQALGSGALNSETNRVVLSAGFNDTYNHLDWDMQSMRDHFVGANRPQIDRIRAAAPHARIQIVGYPTIGSNGTYCLIHAGGRAWDATYMPWVQDWENKAQWMQVDLAVATGTEFVDAKPSTADAGQCGADDVRKYAGLVDFDAGAGNLPIHVNERGHEHLANLVAGS
ncbi:hypothetical protein CMASS_01075 [Corynebacterium massiliense DSM 45435]|uniref:SGNH hydrolase-type esterase domain-containing protein n=1 Tax=Corynebacterium massiliense DSM 45435 TaxID=1121364 RepID=A0ABY7U7F4_9CORY|nr:hypothetical protein CMASS_01075 [Corynebacterium massiliense DSM 45435]